MSAADIAIIGAGPYGLSIAAHLAARDVRTRIFGTPMAFWSQIAAAGNLRFLKSFCFGTDISTPAPGYKFADYSRPRGLETYEPCSIGDFAAYGQWFQRSNVSWVEPVDVAQVAPASGGFALTLANGERCAAARVIVATGLACFANTPTVLASLPPTHVTHTAHVADFSAFAGQDVAVIGAGQSALEAAALLHEAGARPRLLVREQEIIWHTRLLHDRTLWRRLRSPVSKMGTGPTAWALSRFPGLPHRMPDAWRTQFVKTALPAQGAWWLRERVENVVPVDYRTTVAAAGLSGGRVALSLKIAGGGTRQLDVDHVIAGTGYGVNVDRLEFIAPDLRAAIARTESAPLLNSVFESTVPGLHFVGPLSAMSFGPLFRFVVGAEFTAQTVSNHLASRSARAA